MSRTPLDRLALVLIIVGAINWLLIGLFSFDFVSSVFGGPTSLITKTIFTIVGLSGLYSITLLFRESVPSNDKY